MAVSNKSTLIFSEEFYKQERLFKERLDRLNGHTLQTKVQLPSETKHTSNSKYFESLAQKPKRYLHEYNTSDLDTQHLPRTFYSASIVYTDQSDKPFRGSNLIEHINAKLFNSHPRPTRPQEIQRFMAPSISTNITNKYLTKKTAQEMTPLNKPHMHMSIGDVQLFKPQGNHRSTSESPSVQNMKSDRLPPIFKNDGKRSSKNLLDSFIDASKQKVLTSDTLLNKFTRIGMRS